MLSVKEKTGATTSNSVNRLFEERMKGGEEICIYTQTHEHKYRVSLLFTY